MIENYNQTLFQINSRRLQGIYKWCSLILAKVLHTCTFVKKALPENFRGSEYRAFRLYHCDTCFPFYIFKVAQGKKFTSLIKTQFHLPNVAGWSLWLASCFKRFISFRKCKERIIWILLVSNILNHASKTPCEKVNKIFPL